MVKVMEIKKRKNTTDKALEELSNLISSLNSDLSYDIDSFTSSSFECRGDYSEGNPKFTSTAYWEFKNGEIELCANEGEYGEFLADCGHYIPFNYIRRIDFSAAIEALEELVKRYNELSSIKDSEIDRFLSLCKNY